MNKKTLGKTGPKISAIGLGCMGMSEFYGKSDDANSKRVILAALDNGITMLDTADTYGYGHNEMLIAEALREWGGNVFIATKFGIVRKAGEYKRIINGRPEYVCQAAVASLKRLNKEVIDLYYIHRIDPTVPIEETVGAMSDLVREGKCGISGYRNHRWTRSGKPIRPTRSRLFRLNTPYGHVMLRIRYCPL